MGNILNKDWVYSDGAWDYRTVINPKFKDKLSSFKSSAGQAMTNAAPYVSMASEVIDAVDNSDLKWNGSGILDAGSSALMSTGNPYAMAAGLALKGASLLGKRAFGVAENTKSINNINSNLKSMGARQYNAYDSAGIMDVYNQNRNMNHVSASDLGKQGFLTKKLDRKAAQYNNSIDIANSLNQSGLKNMTSNFNKRRASDAALAFSALGGPIQRTPIDDGMYDTVQYAAFDNTLPEYHAGDIVDISPSEARRLENSGYKLKTL